MSIRFHSLALLCAATLAGAGCRPSAGEALPLQGPVQDPPWVLTAVVEASPTNTWTLTGTVRARHEIPLAFRIGGEIQARFVDAGEEVAEGRVLFRLDPRDVTQQRLAAEATVASARAEFENADRERRRLADLLPKRMASEQDHDRAVTAAHAAEQRLLAAQASLEQARNAIDYAALVAPAAGVILEAEGQVGQVVSPGEAVARLAEEGPLEIEVQVPESRRAQLPSLAMMHPLDGLEPVPVELREIAGSADPLSRTWRARYRLPQLQADPGLGSSVTLSFETPRSEGEAVARVPLGAILERGEGAQVWRIDAGRVQPEPVELIGIVGEDAEIRTRLAPGTPVVATGVQLLQSGQAVRVLAR